MFKTKVCTKCKVEKDEWEFHKNCGKLRSRCIDCELEPHRKAREKRKAVFAGVDVYDGTDKTCSKCGEVYPKEKRYWKKDNHRLDGLRSWCRVCFRQSNIGYRNTGDLAMDVISRVVYKWRCERSNKRNKKENATPWIDYSKADFFDMLVQQQGRCAVSDVTLTPDNISIDHIVPVIKGGNHELSNLRLVAWGVNQAMNSLDDDDFIELCRQVIHHQLNVLFYGNRKASVAQLPTEAECITLDADPDLE